jgi:hypothetical protein
MDAISLGPLIGVDKSCYSVCRQRHKEKQLPNLTGSVSPMGYTAGNGKEKHVVDGRAE